MEKLADEMQRMLVSNDGYQTANAVLYTVCYTAYGIRPAAASKSVHEADGLLPSTYPQRNGALGRCALVQRLADRLLVARLLMTRLSFC